MPALSRPNHQHDGDRDKLLFSYCSCCLSGFSRALLVLDGDPLVSVVCFPPSAAEHHGRGRGLWLHHLQQAAAGEPLPPLLWGRCCVPAHGQCGLGAFLCVPVLPGRTRSCCRCSVTPCTDPSRCSGPRTPRSAPSRRAGRSSCTAESTGTCWPPSSKHT